MGKPLLNVFRNFLVIILVDITLDLLETFSGYNDTRQMVPSSKCSGKYPNTADRSHVLPLTYLQPTHRVTHTNCSDNTVTGGLWAKRGGLPVRQQLLKLSIASTDLISLSPNHTTHTRTHTDTQTAFFFS